MSNDKDVGKEKENIAESRKEKSSLESPDAQEARTADAAAIHEIESQNKDRWESEHGMFAIVDQDEVLASKQVGEIPRSSPMVSASGEVLKDEPVGGYEVESSGKDKLLFKLGVSNTERDENLTTDQISALASDNKTAEAGKQMLDALNELPQGDERDTIRYGIKSDITDILQSEFSESIEPGSDFAGTFKALTPDVIADAQGDYDKPVVESGNVFDRISQLPLDKQIQIIGTGLLAFSQEYQHQQVERTIGAAIGVGEGVGSLANDAVELVKGVGSVLQFGQDLMANNPRAIETAGKAGESLGKTLVGGVQLFQMSHDYLFDIGYTGDYSKPFRDISNLGQELDRRWAELPPREQARLATRMGTEAMAGIAIPAGAARLSKTGKVTKLFEELATKAKSVGGKARDKAIDVIAETVDGLSDRLPPLRQELAPAGGPPLGKSRLTDAVKEARLRAQEEKKAHSLMSQADDVGSTGKSSQEPFDNSDALKPNKVSDGIEEVGKKGELPKDYGMSRLSKEELGVENITTLEARKTMTSGKMCVDIDYIEQPQDLPSPNLFKVFRRLKDIARDEGASELTVRGIEWNKELFDVLRKRYNMKVESDGMTESFTLQIKR